MSTSDSGSSGTDMHHDRSLRQRLMALSSRTRICIGIACTVLLACLVVWRLTAEDPNYRTARAHIAAGNYDEAMADLRLCLHGKPSHRKAKGLLAYAIIRQQIDESGGDGPAPEATIREFLIYYGTLASRDTLIPSIRDTQYKDWISERIAEVQDALRGWLKEHDVPFVNWGDLREAVADVSNEVFTQARPLQPNHVDEAFMSVAASMLANNGDGSAAEYLVGRCSTDEAVAPLLLWPGSHIDRLLRTEVRKPSSFLRGRIECTLALLEVPPLVERFFRRHPDLRMPTKADFVETQRAVYDSDVELSAQPYYHDRGPVVCRLFGGIEEMQIMADCANRLGFDPTAVHLRVLPLDAEHYACTLSGFDSKMRRHVARVFAWTTGKWVPVRFRTGKGAETEELASLYPVTISASGKTLTACERTCEKVDRTRWVTRTKEVVKTRREWRYNGTWGIVTVPYRTTESVEEPERYTEYAPGTKEISYQLDIPTGVAVADTIDGADHWAEVPGFGREILDGGPDTYVERAGVFEDVAYRTYEHVKYLDNESIACSLPHTQRDSIRRLRSSVHGWLGATLELGALKSGGGTAWGHMGVSASAKLEEVLGLIVADMLNGAQPTSVEVSALPGLWTQLRTAIDARNAMQDYDSADYDLARYGAVARHEHARLVKLIRHETDTIQTLVLKLPSHSAMRIIQFMANYSRR